MKKNDKIYIFLIIALLVFFFLMFLFVGKKTDEKNVNGITLLLGEDTIWTYDNGVWNNNKDASKVNWNLYKVYLEDEYVDNYYVWNSDKWYIFDKEKNAVNYQERFLATDLDHEINIKKFKTKDIDNETIVDNYLKSKNIYNNNQFTVNSQTSIDLDSDGVDEKIFIISNVFPIDFNPDILFSYVFIEDNGKYIDVYSEELENTYGSGVKPYIYSILDADNDNKLEFIIAYAGFSVEKANIVMYKYENNEIKQLISN